MGRRGRRGQQQQRQQMKGFRPGKEPPELKARKAKEQLGSDASWAQKQTIDALAGKSPREVQKMVGRWVTGLAAAAIVLLLAGALLYTWSWIAGGIVHAIAVAVIVLWWRVRKQRNQIVQMAETLEGGGGGRGGKRRKK